MGISREEAKQRITGILLSIKEVYQINKPMSSWKADCEAIIDQIDAPEKEQPQPDAIRELATNLIEMMGFTDRHEPSHPEPMANGLIHFARAIQRETLLIVLNAYKATSDIETCEILRSAIEGLK
jgi:hypothetical protein